MKHSLIIPGLLLLMCAGNMLAQEYVLENSSTRLTVTGKKITGVYDKIRNVEHGVGTATQKSMLRMQLADGKTLLTEIDMDALTVTATNANDTIKLLFSNTEVEGVAKIYLSTSPGEIGFFVQAKPKNSSYAIAHIDFPSFATPNNYNTKEKYCLTPWREGRLTPISVALSGEGVNNSYFTYPKYLFSQFIGCLGESAGFLLWTNDISGYTKEFGRDYGATSSQFTVKHFMAYEKGKEQILTYPSKITFTGPKWQDAADVYKSWSDQQHWSSVKIKERTDIPAYFKDPVLSITAEIDKGENFTNLPVVLKSWKTKYGVPVIYRPTGWEKHGVWVGIDYFPSYVGDDKLLKLSQDLKIDGNKLATFISGFAWQTEVNSSDEVETDPTVLRGPTSVRNAALLNYYNSNSPLTKVETTRAGSARTPAIRVCRGSDFGEDFLLNTARKMFDFGSTIVHDDVDFGTHNFFSESCFNEAHGHPIPCGLWEVDITRKSFRDIRDTASARGINDFVLTKEYCTELFNQDVHAYQTRFFRQMSDPFLVPLSQYFFHEYVFTTFGWPFMNSAAINDVSMMVISGTKPCLRSSKTQLEGPAGDTNAQVILLKDYFAAMKSHGNEFLSFGKMRRELIEDAPYNNRTITKAVVMKPTGGSQEITLPVPYTEPVPVVIQSAWEDEMGNVGVFAINSQATALTVNVTVPVGGYWLASVYLGGTKQSTKYVYSGQKLQWTLSYGRVASVVFNKVPVNTPRPEETMDFELFPNPVSDKLIINAKSPETIQSIRIYSARGNLVSSLDGNDFTSEIRVNDLQSGVYLIEARSKNQTTIRKKFIKI